MDSGTIQNETADRIGYDAYFSLIKMQSVTLAYGSYDEEVLPAFHGPDIMPHTGLYVPVTVAALQIIWRRHVCLQAKRITTRWLLGLFNLMFFSTTAWFSIVVSEQYLKFQYIFHPVNGNTPSLNERQKVGELLFEKLFSVSPFLQGINFIAADSIIVWRALSLWPERKYLRYIFGFWIFASAGIVLADGFNTVSINIHAAGEASKVDGWQKLDCSSMLMSLSINAAATALILAKVWQTRQLWGNINLWGSKPYRILISLIECGFLFCVIQAINASVSLHNGSSSLFDSLGMFVQSFAVMSPILAGIYPSIVLLIVHQQSAIDGQTNLDIFNTTLSEPRFNHTQHGHGNVSGQDLTSVIRITSQGIDLESGNENPTTFWSRGDPEGLNVHANCGEESRGGASNKDNGRSQRPPKELGA
ncbi:hypothetical protein K435DRAFT_794334 [Dendrothele bispora CBS 962.96]|uniref:Uncharacterized protein n=1 Tax=Dendrothele bispora (strain CBS 962.96) TaxID=1314807 RepID=A0A4S8MCF6_DENBC|nr:hypothetical protein K435DRAFT_794334 [Dendrothele bispora CBS 962.96]